MIRWRKYILWSLLIFMSVNKLLAQTELLAEDYFVKGEYEKAENLYKDLVEKQAGNFYYVERLIRCQQALEKYDEADLTIQNQLTRFPNQLFMEVERGYNMELQGREAAAKESYDKALNYLKLKPAEGFQIANSFLNHQKLEYALESYMVLMQAYPTSNFHDQIALIYGEMGEIEKMFEVYLDMLTQVEQIANVQNIKNFMGRYLTDDDQAANNILLRKILIKKIQNDPRIEWYKTLSWLYIQQKDYSKALIQEKAVHKRNVVDLSGIINLGKIAFDEKSYSTCLDAFSYVLDQTTDPNSQIEAHFYLFESQKKLLILGSSSYESELNKLDQSYQNFFKQYGQTGNTAGIQSSYAQFLTFYKNEPAKAVEVLENSIKTNIDRFKKSELKIQWADILVFNGQYNKALVIYSQVQNELKNHPLAQTARYKVAQTSYFKGDFEWANAQLKVLKSGTTKLIANDAIDLGLLISDNIAQDSVQTALKSYATADLLAYQNKTRQAIDTLNVVLKNFKGHPIEDEALYRQAELFELLGNNDQAIQNFEAIVQLNQDDILIDDAYYKLALLFDEKLFNEEKAKYYYEKIVMEQPSSIYLVPARKRFRELRGDAMIP